MIVGAIMSKYDKKWREENPEKWRESNRKAMAKWRAKCPEKVAANQLRHFIRKYPGIALEIFVAQNSTSDNTTKAEIKPCENDNCVNYSEDYDYNCCYFMDCKERV